MGAAWRKVQPPQIIPASARCEGRGTPREWAHPAARDRLEL
jgi:hypothetical protein